MLELVISDADVSDKTVSKFLELGNSELIDRICIPSFLVSRFIEESPNLYISAIINHPYGLSSSKTKIHEIINSWRDGAKSIDFIINRYHLANKRYNDILKELEACYAIAVERRIDFRVIIESGAIDPSEISKITDILLIVGINDIILSNSHTNIDISDQIIIAKQIMKRTSLRVFCGPVWNVEQYEKMIKSQIYGIRFNSIHTFSSTLKP
jgi:deoxyribose-phosphate aldolase